MVKEGKRREEFEVRGRGSEKSGKGRGRIDRYDIEVKKIKGYL